MSPVEEYIDRLSPAQQELFLALKQMVFAQGEMTLLWKWSIPFFYHKGNPFCYFSLHKTHPHPYLAFMDGHRMANTALQSEGRKRVKVIYIDPDEDLPVAVLKGILWEAMQLRREN